MMEAVLFVAVKKYSYDKQVISLMFPIAIGISV